MRTIPSVRQGKPEQEADYDKLDISGVRVYAHYSLQDFDELAIDVEGSLFGSRLVLSGLGQPTSGCCG